MAKIFVSYSRKDIDFAKRLTAELQKRELDFWIDWEGIPPTVDWWKEIEKGIEEADIFLFLISPDSAKSKVCGQEIDAAVKNGKRIIPIVVREIEWQDTPPQLGHLNYIFFSRDDNFDTAVKKLTTAIRTDYEWAATHRRLQVKALDWERNNKESGFLLRGRDLQDAEQDLATNTSKDPNPTDLQRQFVFESRKATDKQRRTTTSLSIGAAIALAALAAFGFYQANVATERATIARANELAAQSIALRDDNFQLSLLLGIEAYRKLPTLQSKDALFANAQTRPQLRAYLSGNTDKVTKVAFSPDGKTLASGNLNGDIILWNISTRSPEGLQPPNQSYPVFDLAFSPDGEKLGVSGGGGTFLWDITSGTPGDSYDLNPGFTAFSPDGNIWIAGGDRLVLLDRSAEKPSPKELTPPDIMGQPAAFSPDGRTIAYLDTNGNIVLWDVLSEALRVQQPTGDRFSIGSLAFSPDGGLLASGNSDGTISLWSIGNSDGLSPPVTLSGHINTVNSVAFSPDGKYLASGSADRTVIFWDLSTQKPIGQPLTGHTDAVNSVAFSPDSKTLASASDDGNIILWEIKTRQLLSQSVIDLSEYLDNMVFRADNKLLITEGNSGNIEYWDVSSGARITNQHSQQLDIVQNPTANPDWKAILPEEYGYLDISFDVSSAWSSDGKLLAIGSCGAYDAIGDCIDGQIMFWETSTGRFVEPPITGSPFGSLAFSPDAKILAAGGEGVVLWDLETRQPIGLPFTGWQGGIYELAFSPDGNILASYSRDQDYSTNIEINQIFLWDLNPESWVLQSCLRAGRNLTLKEWAKYFPQEPYPTTKEEATCPQWEVAPEEAGSQIPITK